MALKRSVKFGGMLIVIAAVVGAAIYHKSHPSASGGGGGATAATGAAAVTQAFSSSKDQFEGTPVLKLCVNTWGGYAGGQYFNGGFKPSTTSKFWTQYHVPVEFIKIDDAASIDAWKSDRCQVHYGTVGNFSTLVNSLAGEEAQIFFQPDFSYGGDVMIATSTVKSIKDLKNVGGRKGKVALWVGSPSHELLNKALDAAGMTQSEVDIVSTKDAFEAKKVFQAGEADVAVIWSPDDQDLLKSVPGSHVIMSTKQCANCIADIMFAKRSFIESHPAELKALVEGWLKGTAAIYGDPSAKAEAAKILSVGLEQPEDFVSIAMDNARMSTYGDNVNFFNLKGGYNGVTGKSIYDEQSRKFRQIGLIEGEVPDWSKVVNTSILRSISMTDAAQQASGQMTFSAPTSEVAKAQAFATKSVTVEFPTGSFKLTDAAMIKIDQDVSPTVKSFTGARIRVEGNTDNVGNDAGNQALSQRRAQSVVDYLVNKYGYDRKRFLPVGNGSTHPVTGCEANADDACRAKNRRTDVEVLTTP